MDSAWDTACAVGCPIRRSTDQSLLAAPHGLSQRAASFIASQCQGIHQMPFRRLILFSGCATRRGKPWRTSTPQDAFDRRTNPARGRPEVRPRSLNNRLHTVHDPAPGSRWEPRSSRCRVALPSYGSPGTSGPDPGASTPADWWRQTGSNRRPPACKAGALPTELCPPVGAKRLRPDGWWAREDLNLRPHAYQARALTN